MQPSIYIGSDTNPEELPVRLSPSEPSRASKYGARLRKLRASQRPTPTPRRDAYGLSVAGSDWLPDLGEFELID